jgi:hypothetical protein
MAEDRKEDREGQRKEAARQREQELAQSELSWATAIARRTYCASFAG